MLYVYRDGRHCPDGKEHVERLVQNALGSYWTSAKSTEVVRWLCQSTRVEAEAVDTSGFVNVQNGLLELGTGELQPHTPDVRSTVQLPVSWNPEAKCEPADHFLHEVLPSPETRQLMEEIVGYCLLPDCRFQKAVMLVGEGANGKSVFLDVLAALFGRKNIASESLQDLSDDRFSAVSLVGKIANISPDLPRQALKDAGMFKAIASGDAISVQKKYGDRFQAVIRAKLLFSANELPESRDLTRGFFRRWIIIPFPARFEGRVADTTLRETLTTPDALPYWLGLGVRGLQRLLKQGGFSTTPETESELDKYKTACDTVRAFIEEACEVAEDAVEKKQDLYDAYRQWCEDSGCGAKKKVAFFQRLYSEAPSVKETRPSEGGNRVKCVRGIRVRKELPEPVVQPTGQVVPMDPWAGAPAPAPVNKEAG